MTTGLVAGITDELVAELEALASGACQSFGDDWFPSDSLWSAMEKDDAAYVEKASPWLIRALLAERAELLRDARRWRWLREKTQSDVDGYRNGIPVLVHADEWCPEWRERLDAAIDAAMQSEAQS